MVTGSNNSALTPMLYSVGDAARVLSLGRSKVYELIGRGELRTVKVGRRRLVPADALGEYVSRLTRYGDD